MTTTAPALRTDCIEHLSREHHPARRRFEALVDSGIEAEHLAEAALLICAEEYDALDVASELQRLDTLAQHVADRIVAAEHELTRLEILTAYLFEECGFAGNDEDYYDPRNSYLSQVLDRRVGIPITLAVLIMEVGARTGITLQGVGFPGHFLLSHPNLPGVYVDAFHKGRLLAVPDCKSLLEQASGGRIPFDAGMLAPVSARQILARMLNNLKVIHARNHDFTRAIADADRILLLQPTARGHLRDRGLLRLEAGAVRPAIEDLDEYLKHANGASDWVAVHNRLELARTRVRQLN